MLRFPCPDRICLSQKSVDDRQLTLESRNNFCAILRAELLCRIAEIQPELLELQGHSNTMLKMQHKPAKCSTRLLPLWVTRMVHLPISLSIINTVRPMAP